MSKKLNEITVDELKEIIRDVVSEELAKRYVTIPSPQPFYPNPYQQYCPYYDQNYRITVTDHTEEIK